MDFEGFAKIITDWFYNVNVKLFLDPHWHLHWDPFYICFHCRDPSLCPTWVDSVQPVWWQPGDRMEFGHPPLRHGLWRHTLWNRRTNCGGKVQVQGPAWQEGQPRWGKTMETFILSYWYYNPRFVNSTLWGFHRPNHTNGTLAQMWMCHLVLLVYYVLLKQNWLTYEAFWDQFWPVWKLYLWLRSYP